MKANCSILLVLALTGAAALSLAGGQEAKPIKLAPVRIMEVRTVGPDAPWEAFHRPQGWKGLLVLTVRLEGSLGLNATRWRDLQIDEAVDDLGNKILPAPPNGFLPVTQPEQSSWRSIELDGNKPGASAIPMVSFDFYGGPRRAVRLARLRGQLLLQTGGQEKVVVLPKLKSAIGTVIHDATLAGAGLELRVDPAPSNLATELTVSLKGDSAGIWSIDVVDPANNSVITWPMLARSKDPVSIDLSSPVDDSMTLRVTVMYGQKLEKVHFDFRDIPLP